MSILVNRPDNKRRPPDWRWQRACELVDGDSVVRGRDDEIVRLATKFKRLINRCSTDRDKLSALDANPELYEAFAIYDTAEDHPSSERWELEARLLSKEPLDAVASKMGLELVTLLTYEKVFFDVLDRLHAPSLVMHTVIGNAMQTGLAERDHDCLWKLFAYWVGPYILDTLVYKFNCPNHSESHDGLRAVMRDFTKDTIDIKAGITMLTMPINWQTRELVLTLWKDLIALEMQAGQVGIGAESYSQNVQALIDTIEGSLIKYRPGVDPEIVGQASKLEAGGVRLRSSEHVSVAMGNIPDGLLQLVKSATYPSEVIDE